MFTTFRPCVSCWILAIGAGFLAGIAPTGSLAHPSQAHASGCLPAQAERQAESAPRLIQPFPPVAAEQGDYRSQLQTTASGWPRLNHWCVWIEPGAPEQRWQPAIERALAVWQELLPVERVLDSDRAQILILHRRPPLGERDGRQRASHGRASLRIRQVRRDGEWRLEPWVLVLVDSTQRQAGIQATALHELGHAFGLWGHSPDLNDVMAAAPRSQPLLQLSPRDLASLRWLNQQPTDFGRVTSWSAEP